jgi:hypothetical protein
LESTFDISESNPDVTFTILLSKPWKLFKYFWSVKGTVARDFPPFFHQKYPPWTLIHILIFFFKFGSKFVELLQLKFDSPLYHAAGSQISQLHHAAGSQIFLLHFAAESCDSLLHFA